jgi:hypothetical protein
LNGCAWWPFGLPRGFYFSFLVPFKKKSFPAYPELRNKQKKRRKRGGVEEFRSIKIGVSFRVYGLVHN